MVVTLYLPGEYYIPGDTLPLPTLGDFFQRALLSLHSAWALDMPGRARLGKHGHARKWAAMGNPESCDVAARAIALSGVHSL